MLLDVDAVCFDLDDTLCVYERTVEDVLDVAFERAGIESFFDGGTYRAYFDRFLDDFGDVDELRAHCFAEIAADQERDPDLGRPSPRSTQRFGIRRTFGRELAFPRPFASWQRSTRSRSSRTATP